MNFHEKTPDGTQEHQFTDANSTHPRDGIPKWKWVCTLIVVLLLSITNGYDVSNVANIQPEIYRAFGHMDVLPWVGLAYSASSVSVQPIARQLLYCFDIRYITLLGVLGFIVGAAVSGLAQNIHTLIVGRIILGIGGGIAQQCVFTYNSFFATPAESTRLAALIGVTWAVGLVSGGPIGSAFSENIITTWRWAFYINIPFMAVAFALGIVGLPSRSVAHDVPLSSRLSAIDPVGCALHATLISLFCVATTFSGAVWAWNDGRTISLWAVFGVVLLGYAIQQAKSLFTKPKNRAIPVHLFANRRLIPLWIATACAGNSYAVTLYYTPLYFAFSQGLEPLEQTIRILPFILSFIVSVFLSGYIIPKIGRYTLVYIVAGVITLAGGATMALTLNASTPQEQVMGLLACIGFALGAYFQQGHGLSNVILKNSQDRIDNTTILNICQLGGVAIAYSVADCIYQNVGFRLRSAADAASEAISKEFYLLVSGGAVCILSALFMEWESYGMGR